MFKHQILGGLPMFECLFIKVLDSFLGAITQEGAFSKYWEDCEISLTFLPVITSHWRTNLLSANTDGCDNAAWHYLSESGDQLTMRHVIHAGHVWWDGPSPSRSCSRLLLDHCHVTRVTTSPGTCSTATQDGWCGIPHLNTSLYVCLKRE